MNIRPIVEWQSPKLIPDVPKGEVKTFWLAVRRIAKNGASNPFVFAAQYVNKPLEYPDGDTSDEPVDNNYLVDCDGEPIDAVGWFSEKDSVEFDGYYEPITFDDNYQLLGWGEYLRPEFIGIFHDANGENASQTNQDQYYCQCDNPACGNWFDVSEVGVACKECGHGEMHPQDVELY